MTVTSAAVKPGVLGLHGYPLYDWRDTLTRKQRKRRVELVPAVARYEQVARLLRARIYAGEWSPGVTLPGAPSLSRTLGVTQSVAQRALEVLEGSGVVRMEAGRGSVVLERHRYHVSASLPWAQEGDPPERAMRELAAAVTTAERANPAISDAAVVRRSGVAAVTMTVEVPDAAHAAAHAGSVMRAACGTGWDLAGASVEARPADGD